MKKSLVSALVIAVTLTIAFVVHAQSNSPVRVYVESPLPDNAAGIRFRREFFNAVSLRLAEEGYQIVLLDSSSMGHQDPELFVILQYDEYSAGDMYIEIRQSPLTDISPILHESNIYFSLDPRQTAEFMMTAIVFYTVERCDLTNSYLDQAWQNLGSGFDDDEVVTLRANCAIVSKNYENAIETYEGMGESAHIDPESFNYAWVLYQVGQTSDALKMADYLASLGKHDKALSVDSLKRKSLLLALDSRFQDAITDLSAAVTIGLDPFYTNYGPFTPTDMAEVYTERGLLFFGTEEPTLALSDYQAALALDRNYAPAYFYRGILYCREAMPESASQDFNQYLTLSPNGEYTDEAGSYIRLLTLDPANETCREWTYHYR